MNDGLHLIGVVQAVYKTFERTNKAGESYGGDHRVQFVTTERMAEGERLVPYDLRADDPAPFKAAIGQKVALPVRAFSPSKGSVYYTAAGKLTPLASPTR